MFSPSEIVQERPAGWRAQWLVVMFFGLLHVLPFAVRPALIGGDEPHYALMAHSLAVGGETGLAADYRAVEAGSAAAGRKFAGRPIDRHLRTIDGREVFSHPLGLPLLAVPLLALQQRLTPGAAPDLVLGLLTLSVTAGGLLAGRRLLARLTAGLAEADLLAFALYFTTPLWYYSRTFFTEPYLWAVSVLAVAALAARRFWLAGCLLGGLFLLKETAVFLIFPVVGFAAVRLGFWRGAQLVCGPFAALLLWLGKNHVLYGRFWVPFQPFVAGDLGAGLWGVLFDPRHGLLLFAPIVAAALPGWLSPAILDRPWRRAAGWALAVFLGFYGLTSAWIAWHGGACYGPRLLVPAIPAFALPLAALWRGGETRPWLRRLLLGLMTLGFALQWCAVTDPFSAMWSPSIAELLGRPERTLTGLALGGLLVWWLNRRLAPRDQARSATRRTW